MNDTSLQNSIQIRTGSRLHCGLFSDPAPGGRRHQGIGIMIDSPFFEITATKTDQGTAKIIASDEVSERISKVTALLDNALDGTQEFDLTFTVKNSPPLHCGFGSGTQLALAVGTLWARLHGLEMKTLELAQFLRRAKRSCIGTFGFDRGGFLIDRGMTPDDEVGSCRFHSYLPENWRFLLMRPLGEKGIFGSKEIEAFRSLPPLDPDSLLRLQELLSVLESNPSQFETFSNALREYGLIVGNSFKPVQGGCFSSSTGEQFFELLTSCGIQGIAQSSWGPAMFALCKDTEQAGQMMKIVKEKLSHVDVEIVSPLNQGKTITDLTSVSQN